MAAKNIKKHRDLYAKLLRLYPASFRNKFSEPMLQTFGDMYLETVEEGTNIRIFVIKIYAETLLNIIREQMKEVVMNIKDKSAKRNAVIVIVVVIAAISLFAAYKYLTRTVEIISPNSTLEQARQLSGGEKEPCLDNVSQAREAVKSDDRYLDPEETFSKFELTAVSGIIDVPAGTEVDVTVNSYANNIAKGAILYEGDYGDYNYEITKSAEKGDWELKGLIACQQQ